jgi:hypothetical protein
MAGHIKAYDSGEFSIDIGTPSAYEKAQKIWPEIMSAES